jgi:HD superfamily phosphohydrolase
MVRGAELICENTWPGDSDFLLPGCGVTLKRSDLESLAVSIPHEVKERMEHVSQIGMKNHYFGKRPGAHNRWNHARGVYTIGLLWLHALYSGDAVPNHLKTKPYPDYATARTLIGYCLLLHDYGHLPFSHLLEEAIHSINWVPVESGQSSLEYTVLRDRLTKDSLAEILRDTISQAFPSSAHEVIKDDPIRALIQLTHGWSGMPWLQAIVNSSIDADKIDYLRRDQQFLQTCGFPIQTRLALYSGDHTENLPWLKEFLCDQFINHLGFLCLPGRSAIAAIDLWRERLHLYERFYLSPAVRTAERITLEIVQQFLIRAVMSESFGKQILSQPAIASAVKEGLDVRNLGLLMQQNAGSQGGLDVISIKYNAVTDLLNRLSSLFGQTGERDWECFTFMAERVLEVQSTSQRYKEMLENCVAILRSLRDGSMRLTEFANSLIIGDPIQFHREHLRTVTEIVRSFQHQYFADVLIDVHAMPRALSIPPNPRPTPKSRSPRFVQLLVPKGPAEQWSPASHELEPLTLEKVRSLERPFGRVILLSPPESNKATARYVFDRLMAEMRQREILYQEG